MGRISLTPGLMRSRLAVFIGGVVLRAAWAWLRGMGLGTPLAITALLTTGRSATSVCAAGCRGASTAMAGAARPTGTTGISMAAQALLALHSARASAGQACKGRIMGRLLLGARTGRLALGSLGLLVEH